MLNGESASNDRVAKLLAQPYRTGFAVVLGIIGLLEIIVPIGFVVIDGRPIQVNTRNVWLPLAEAVFSGGDLYLSQWDNKPPLFQFINLAVYATGAYKLVFFIIIGLANGATAVLIWKLCQRHGFDVIGAIAALLFLATAPATANALQIDPRQFANVCLLLALLASSSVRAGALVAAAGLLSQFSVLTIPLVIWTHVRARPDRVAWTARFAIAGLTVVAIAFAIVLAVWGSEAAATGFEYSFFSASDYVQRYVDQGIGLFGDPIGWTFYQFAAVVDNLLLVGLAAIGACMTVTATQTNRVRLGTVALAGAGLLLLPRLIRSGPIYLLPPLPFLSILATFGMQEAHTVIAEAIRSNAS